MNVPWRYILALPLGLCLGISVFIGLLCTQLGVPTETTHYMSDISQKQEQLAESRSGPKLLIEAGSSALFGINAELIEKQTGVPAINMGFAAFLDLDYRFYRLERILRPGDTILLACEYESYTDSMFYDTTDDYILSRDPEYFWKMSILDKIGMATRIPFKRLQKGWRNRRTPEHIVIKNANSPYNPFAYSHHPIDDNGDEMLNGVAVRPSPDIPFVKGNLQRQVPTLVDGMPTGKTKGFEILATFIAWARAHHVTVLATFPNIVYQPVYDEANGKETIRIINNFYAAQGVPMIGTAREAMLPVDQFYDFMYHPTHEEALQRTGRLIPELQPYLHPSR